MKSPLFERQATGGVVARDGFGYQDAYLLQNMPLFLSQSAFSHAVSEVLGDIEVRYHRPGGGTFCVLYEAKRHQLSKSELWGEVAHFQELYRHAPIEYVRFVLVCGDFIGELQPLRRQLERLRGPGASLNEDSSIRAAAEADIVATVVGLGQPAEVGQFVLKHVDFVKYDDSQMEGGFYESLGRNLPELCNLRLPQTRELLVQFKRLVDASVKGLVSRRALEDAVVNAAGESTTEWLSTPSDIALRSFPSSDFRSLTLDVGPFNGPDRGRLGIQQWARLLSDAQGLGNFLLSSRARRTVRLSAKQRISVACTLGYCYSATRGFVLKMEHNGLTFDTSMHECDGDNFFRVSNRNADSTSKNGIACISFPTPAEVDVLAAAEGLDLADAPKLFLSSEKAVTDIRVLNAAVREAKAALVAFRAAHQLERLHLIIKAPSHFAMAFGHRLNGLGSVQLYDWVDTGYAPTALLQ